MTKPLSEMLGMGERVGNRRSGNIFSEGKIDGYNECIADLDQCRVDVEKLAKVLQEYFGIIEVHPHDMINSDLARKTEVFVNWTMTGALAQYIIDNIPVWIVREGK